MRASRTGYIQRQFHLIQHALQFGSRNRADDNTAFVAHDFRCLTLDDPKQAAAAVRITEIGVRKEWSRQIPSLYTTAMFGETPNTPKCASDRIACARRRQTATN